jgi:hypothetical protein
MATNLHAEAANNDPTSLTNGESPMRIVSVLLAGLLAGPVSAQDPSDQSETFTVFGASDCGSWVAQNDIPQKAWLLGYLSGMNRIHYATDGIPSDPLVALESADQAFIWMDKWCSENPLKKVPEGAVLLFVELMKMRSGK